MSADLEMRRIPARGTKALHVEDLDGTIEQLLHRHLDTTREWFPHEYVPWDRAGGADWSAEWQAEDSSMSEAARVALFVNLLTEDNLPYYMFELAALSTDGPWGEWTRRWTAEEGRHAIVMRDYLTVTRALDPVALERGRMQQVSTGIAPQCGSLADALVYTSLQELATRISHRNTGKLIDDRAGVEVMNRVAADENLHYLFYRDLADRGDRGRAVGDGDGDRTERVQLRDAGHRHHRLCRACTRDGRRGVYDFAIHHDQVVAPVVLHHWKLDRIEGLDAEAEAAREHTLAYIARLGKAAGRIRERSEAATAR